MDLVHRPGGSRHGANIKQFPESTLRDKHDIHCD